VPTDNHRDAQQLEAEHDPHPEQWSLAPEQREALQAILGAADEQSLQRTGRLLFEAARVAADELVRIAAAIRVRNDAGSIAGPREAGLQNEDPEARVVVDGPTIVLRASSPREAFFDGLGDLLCLSPEPESLYGLRAVRHRPRSQLRAGLRKKSADTEATSDR